MNKVAYINTRGGNTGTGTGSYRKNLLQELQYLASEEGIDIDEIQVQGKKSKILQSISNDLRSYDLIHLEPDIHWYLGLLLRRMVSHSPHIVLTMHGVSPILYKKKVPFKQRIRVGQIIKRLSPLIDGIFTVSNSERYLISKALNYPADDIYVTYNGNNYGGLSPSNVARKPPHNRKYILHVSNTPNWRKDPDLLLDSFKAVVGSNDSIDLLLVGEGWKREEIQSSISKKGLNNRITLVGKVSPHELPKFYNHAELYLQTSVYESFCMPVVEAMNFGTPVVTTTAYALPEIAQDAAMYTDRIPSQISNAIIELLNNRDLYREKSQKSMEVAKNYSWKKSAIQTLQSYREILD